MEEEARREASANEAAWMDAGHIRPDKLVGQWVHVIGKDKGKVSGYQDLVDLHTISFEELGTWSDNLE